MKIIFAAWFGDKPASPGVSGAVFPAFGIDIGDGQSFLVDKEWTTPDNPDLQSAFARIADATWHLHIMQKLDKRPFQVVIDHINWANVTKLEWDSYGRLVFNNNEMIIRVTDEWSNVPTTKLKAPFKLDWEPLKINGEKIKAKKRPNIVLVCATRRLLNDISDT